MDTIEKKRKKLVQEITGTLLTLLNHDLIDEDEARDIARHLLKHKDSINTHEDIGIFLEKFSDKWSLFKFHLEDYMQDQNKAQHN